MMKLANLLEKIKSNRVYRLFSSRKFNCKAVGQEISKIAKKHINKLNINPTITIIVPECKDKQT